MRVPWRGVYLDGEVGERVGIAVVANDKELAVETWQHQQVVLVVSVVALDGTGTIALVEHRATTRAATRAATRATTRAATRAAARAATR